MIEYDYIYKIILAGDTFVGKSSLKNRFFDGSFDETNESTIGVDFRTLIIIDDEKKIKIQLWDPSGQERFRSIIRSYYRGSDGVILMFDLSNKKSFDNMEYWLEDVKINSGNLSIPVVLVGNKSDKTSVVKDKDIEDFVTKYSANIIKFFKCSVLHNNNIDNSYNTLIRFISSSEGYINKLKHIKQVQFEEKNKVKKCSSCFQ
jgi:small GTP-binding protein